MKKEIIYEIYRQHQIMGIYKPLLRENKYVDLVSDGIKTLLVKAKSIPDVADEVLIGGIQVSKRFVDDLYQILEDPSYFQLLTKKQKEIFGELVAQDEGIVDEIYTNLINGFTKETGKSEKTLITTFAKEVAQGKKISDVINTINGEEDVFLNTILNNKIKKEIKNIKLPKPGSKLAIDPTTGLPWESPEYVPQIAKQLNKYQTILKKRGVYAAGKYFKESIYQYEKFWVQYLRNYWADTLFNWKNVQINNINKAKKFLNKAYELEKNNEGAEAVRELQKALSQILLYKRNPKMDVNEIIKKFITENPNLEKETIKKFLEDDVAGKKLMRDFLDDIGNSMTQNVRKPLDTELKAFLELVPGVGALTRESNIVTTLKEIITIPLQRWFNLIVWKDPRSAYEVMVAMGKRGVRKEYTSKLTSYFLAHILLIPGLISIFKSVKEQLEADVLGSYLEVLNKFCDDGLLTQGCEEIKKQLAEIHYYQSEDYVKNYLKELPLHIGTLFGEKYGDTSTLGFDWYGIWYKTYIDETVELIYRWIQGTPFPIIGKPRADKVLNILENISKKAYQELVASGFNPDAENLTQETVRVFRNKTKNVPEEAKKVEEVVVEKVDNAVDKVIDKAEEVVTDIADSEAGFRAWCLKERKTPREVEPYNPDTHFAYTNDGKKWFYDKGTFNPKPE